MNVMGGYGPMRPLVKNEVKKEQKTPTFKLLKHPHELEKLEIVWNIALACVNPEVVPKAIDFLIKVYYSLDADLDSMKIKV
jgi:hypothetical protein